jgi:hypothetical protein
VNRLNVSSAWKDALRRGSQSLRFVAFHSGLPIRFAAIFVVCSSIFVPIAASLVPPMQNADETAHFHRVDQIAHGGIIAVRFGGGVSSGGMVDRGADAIEHIMEAIPFHPDRKVTAAMLRQIGTVRWGARGMIFFLNTALYPPFLYGPATIGLWIAALGHASVVHSLFVMRVVNGFACIAIGGAAIALAGATAPWLFIVLSLPMAQSLFSAVSQDGMMLALSALAASLISRLGAYRRPPPRAALGLLCVCLCCVIMARPSYLPLAILPAVLPGLTRRSRLLCLAAIVIPVAAWIGLVTAYTSIDAYATTGISPRVQAWFLVTHPGAWRTIARATIGDGWWIYAREFIGILGWLDVLLPVLFYPLACLVLAVALATSSPAIPCGLNRRARACIGGALAAGGLAIFLAQYLTWTPVGSLSAAGVQGRYFLPLAMFLPLLRKPRDGAGRWLVPRLALLAFPCVAIGVVVPVLVYRYYI